MSGEGATITAASRTLVIDAKTVTRFWAKVDKAGPDGCWLWTASLNGHGYGQFGIGGTAGRLVLAHRVAWVLAGHRLTSGLVLDHLCHTRRCANPDHLREVTVAANVANRSGADRDSRSGIRGVVWHSRVGRWEARARTGGRAYSGGYFDDPADAEAAAIRLRIRLGVASLADPLRLAELAPESKSEILTTRSTHV